jgi:hypothetical protein
MFQETIVSEDLLERFCLQFDACKGACCCVDGFDAGALIKFGLKILRSIYPRSNPFTQAGITAIGARNLGQRELMVILKHH